jgi:hypothetical protein
MTTGSIDSREALASPPAPRLAAAPGMAIFRPPYQGWTPAALLAHFQNRRSINYFPILDEVETRPEKLDAILSNCFEFNGERYQLPQGFDWTKNPSADREWFILLHKWYYAPGLGALYHQTGDERYVATWMELTHSWIDTVPFDLLPSDVLGRRVQNWIFAHYYFVSQTRAPLIAPDFYLKFMTSLHDQVCYLRQNLTPARNHRTLELTAIFWAAAVFPEFAAAEEWLEFSRQELLKNMQADLLADGVQVELSTDYHHLVLKNYLGIRRLAVLNDIPMPPAMDELLPRALEFALYAHKPDGYIPSLSDGDVGSHLDLIQQGYDLYGSQPMRYVATQGRHGRPPSPRSRWFPHSGYIVLRSGWGDGVEPYADERYLIFDCGPLGAGNHGHLDLLSFEAAAYGRSLIVDPGRYTYDESGNFNWRARFRGTGYHNTVQVDQKDQTRYRLHKGRYRIQGPEPAHEVKAFISGRDYDYVHGAAYSHEYPAAHDRQVFFPWLDYWIVSDFLDSPEPHDYDLLFHLAPHAWEQVHVERATSDCLVHAPHLVIAQAAEEQTQLFVEDGYFSPVYGVKQPAPSIRFARRAASTVFHTVLYPYRAERPSVTVAAVPVYRGDRLCAATEAFALQVSLVIDKLSYTDTYFNAAASGQPGPYRFGHFSFDGLLLCIRQDSTSRIVRVQGQPGTLAPMGGTAIEVT